MNSDNLDYSYTCIKSFGEVNNAFEAWFVDDEEKTYLVEVAEFLEYCRQSGIIHPDTFISNKGEGLVSEPYTEQRWDAGRQEMYDVQLRAIEYTFAEYLYEFSGNGLHGAIFKYLQDSTTAAQAA